DLLYAGTETGVFYSPDGGAGWRPLQLNLPVVPITDLTLKNDDLIAATQGRAFWFLDDVTPLAVLAADPTDTVRLFPPPDAVRGRHGGFGRAPAGTGQNPPSGALITYQLPSAQPVTLDFLDSSGSLVKSFSSADRSGPPSTPGLHRFAWDLRYPDAHGIESGTF